MEDHSKNLETAMLFSNPTDVKRNICLNMQVPSTKTCRMWFLAATDNHIRFPCWNAHWD